VNEVPITAQGKTHKIEQSLFLQEFLQEFLRSPIVLKTYSDGSLKKQYAADTVTGSEKIHLSHILIKGQQKMGR